MIAWVVVGGFDEPLLALSNVVGGVYGQLL